MLAGIRFAATMRVSGRSRDTWGCSSCTSVDCDNANAVAVAVAEVPPLSLAPLLETVLRFTAAEAQSDDASVGDAIGGSRRWAGAPDMTAQRIGEGVDERREENHMKINIVSQTGYRGRRILGRR